MEAIKIYDEFWALVSNDDKFKKIIWCQKNDKYKPGMTIYNDPMFITNTLEKYIDIKMYLPEDEKNNLEEYLNFIKW
jgi:hypothetical protein